MVTVGAAYRIRPGAPGDGPGCAALEHAAGQMFRDSPHPDIAEHPPSDPEAFEPLAAAGRLIVLETADGALIVGAAIMALAGEDAHICEFDVLPAHQGRGLGAQLLDACAAWGRGLGARRLTLTTFRDVAWNQPYYERRGFREIAETDGNAEIDAELALGIEEGWGGPCRVAMARPIPPRGPETVDIRVSAA